MLVSTIFVFFFSLLPFAAGGTHRSFHRQRHQDIAQRAPGDIKIYKRTDNARFTFYDVGLGACGQISSPTDFVVALSTLNWGSGYPSSSCFQSITISYGGKTAQATIIDECMGCPSGGLDFSMGLFAYFASESAGVIYGSWSSGGASEPSPTTSTSIWTPTSTPTPTPSSTTPTSTWTPPTTTTSSTTSTTPTTSSTSTSTTSASTTSVSSSTSATTSTSVTNTTSTSTTDTASASGTAVPTGVVAAPNDGEAQNLGALNDAIITLAKLLAHECGA